MQYHSLDILASFEMTLPGVDILNQIPVHFGVSPKGSLLADAGTQCLYFLSPYLIVRHSWMPSLIPHPLALRLDMEELRSVLFCSLAGTGP